MWHFKKALNLKQQFYGSDNIELAIILHNIGINFRM